MQMLSGYVVIVNSHLFNSVACAAPVCHNNNNHYYTVHIISITPFYCNCEGASRRLVSGY